MGSIKDRNGMDLTEAEDIKNRWQEYTEELYKKDLHDQDNHDVVITECEVKFSGSFFSVCPGFYVPVLCGQFLSLCLSNSLIFFLKCLICCVSQSVSFTQTLQCFL